MNRFSLTALFLALSSLLASAQDEPEASVGIDERLDAFLKPIADVFDAVIFFSVPMFGASVPVVLIVLAFTAVFLTLFFGFINLRALPLAYRTVRGRYSSSNDPGEITHFQALSTAVSATVGLGNIAGVAIAIGIGGPGAVFWMVFMGFMGMTSKFTECTLGVKYRSIDEKGRAHGGGMYYLSRGLAERGMGGFGKVLAVIFAVATIGGAIGAGNMFQINQAHQQISETFGIFQNTDGSGSGGVMFGAIVAVLVGAVIIGGIRSIARVTSFLVPFMCIAYVLACVIVLAGHITEVPAAFGVIISEAFTGSAVGGGLIGALIQGVKRGVFSNEAGVGSAAMAHAAVKTQKPASEGIVALLEPFIDTVVVCTMTALVIVVTGMWKIDASVEQSLPLYDTAELVQFTDPTALGKSALSDGDRVKILDWEGNADGAAFEDADWAQIRLDDGETTAFVPNMGITERKGTKGGIWMTSEAFKGVISWFPSVLAVAVFLFAFSTMISWSYYGEQAVNYLTNNSGAAVIGYKFFFCVCIVIGAAASLGNVLRLSDAMFFAMVIPNMIGLYVLLPVVRRELKDFRTFTKQVDAAK